MNKYIYAVYNYPSDHSGWQVVERIFLTEEEARKYQKESKAEYIKKYEVGTDFEDWSNEDLKNE